MLRLLDLAKPFLPLLPEVEAPLEKVLFDDKILYTITGGFIYLLLALPLAGVKTLPPTDPFLWLRPVVGSERGTLLELGLAPVLTAGFLFQVLAGLRSLATNLLLRSDRELFQTAQKVTAIVLLVVYAVGLSASGYFGTFDSASTYVVVAAQVAAAGIALTYLLEVFDKGYGFGLGAFAFITLNVATTLVSDIAGLDLTTTPSGTQFRGVVIHLVRNALSHPIQAVIDVATRTTLPNLFLVALLLVTILAVIYLQNLRLELPVRSTQVRLVASVYPIRLLYTGTLPILFSYTVLYNIQWAGVVVSGVVPAVAPFLAYPLYYLSPPTLVVNAITLPIRTVVFSAVVAATAVPFSTFWALTSGTSGKELAAEFKKQNISLGGKRDGLVVKELNKTIAVAASTGAAVVVAVTLGSELLGGLGRGAGAVVAIGSAFVFLEEFAGEMQQGGTSQFASVLGGK